VSRGLSNFSPLPEKGLQEMKKLLLLNQLNPEKRTTNRVLAHLTLHGFNFWIAQNNWERIAATNDGAVGCSRR
jgi:hypothetical protein